MSLKIVLAVVALFFSSSIALAQNPYHVEFNEVNGILKSTDKYKKDFGRYQGFEFPLYEGEKANFALFSSGFDARMILVDPNGKVYRRSGEAREGVVSILTEIPISGDWILYVVGDKDDYGGFALRYALASVNSYNISQNMDLCSSLNFLIAHTPAYFMMLPIDQINSSGMELIGANGFAEFGEEDGSLVITKYSGASEKSAKMQYEYLIDRIGNCVGDWEISEFRTENNTVAEQISGTMFTNKAEKFGVKIFIELFTQLSVTKINANSYTVSITIKK
ncbi:MAG: hypothetical protein FD143_1351 [Ignavibacteria bacterium]|nr:MAG: hypothetical protein FD143_1351 [Ignavibacteria bacterium]KAF0160657.1 MAG: hypothetical protein FD188_1564 [Ignavibacteria bacterium]